MGRLLDASRDLRLERAIFAPPPPSPTPGGGAEYGGDFLYDAGWVESATGGAPPRDAAPEVALAALAADDDEGWGAPGGPLTVPGREAAEALRAAGRAASRAAARLSVVTAALRFLSVAAGTLPSVLDDDEGDDEGDASATVASAAEREGLLSSWSPKDRAGTVRAALKALDAARAASDEEGAEHAAALAAELADVVALSTRLWARSARERCRTTPAAATTASGPAGGFGSKLDLAANGAASEAETAEEAFELASALASAAASALARPPEAPRGASETLARPLLVAALDSVRAWRAAATARDFPRGFFAESAELGQRLVPLAPALFASGSVAGGGADAALALSILREMASGLVSHAALVEAAGTRALLPPFLPPPPPAIAPAETCAFDDASSLVAAFPFERLGDAPAIALRPFLEASHPAAREPWAAAAEKENARADADANADAHARSNGGKLGDAEISETRAGAGGAETPAALRLCLALGRSREGAKALQDAGLTDRLADLCASLSQPPYVDAAAATMAVETSGGSNPRRLYCLALRVAATHADASGDARDAGEGLVSLCVRLADRLEDALAPSELTLDALEEAEATAGLMHAVAAAAGGSWQLAAPTGLARARAAAAEFLRWIAAPPPPRRGVACAPRNDAERDAAARDPLVGCGTGWFHSCAIGSAPPAAPGSAAIAAAVAASSSAPVGNAHSEAVATRLYAAAARCAAFLAAFPRISAAAMLGTETTESLGNQATAMTLEAERRKKKDEESDARADARNDVVRNVGASLFKSVSAIEAMEEGKTPPTPVMRLNSSYSLITQMSWRATPPGR